MDKKIISIIILILIINNSVYVFADSSNPTGFVSDVLPSTTTIIESQEPSSGVDDTTASQLPIVNSDISSTSVTQSVGEILRFK